MEHSNELQHKGKLKQYKFVVEPQLQNLRKFDRTNYHCKNCPSFALVTAFFIGKRLVSLRQNCSF